LSERPDVALGPLPLERGGHLLVLHALSGVLPGERVRVVGTAPGLSVTLGAWARGRGHRVVGSEPDGALVVERGAADRRVFAVRAGAVDAQEEGALAAAPNATWGVAARGALVEAGGPAWDFPLRDKHVVWTDDAPRLYAQALAAQWDPAIAIPWQSALVLPDAVEDAVVQVMTYLVENETAALLVPARFLARLHPHFREIMQLLAVQAADEARHIEVFTRRARLFRRELGLSTVGGQTSLKTLVDEPDFALASFLTSVLGEGSFLDLLWFLRENAPDPVTEAVSRLAAQDEARHVAFGMAHLTRHLAHEPDLRPRLEAAVLSRHDALASSAGLNEEVFDALVLLAAGSFEIQAISRGFEAVTGLVEAMDRGRRLRLGRLGWAPERAAELSSLHTRNFM
jgi:hypothetical protein